MTLDTPWAQLIHALQDPESTNSTAKRATLLTSALALGTTIADHAVACSVTQRSETGYRTPASSDPLALDLDLVQYAADEGPCMAACRDGREHHIADMIAATVHPVFVAAARERGVLSSLSLPLGDGAPGSALNLYAARPDVFSDPRARNGAALLARCVARLVPDTGDLAGGAVVPSEVLAHRETMRRAVAVLQEQGMTAQQSFDALVTASRRRGDSVFVVAGQILASVVPDA